MGTDPGPGLGGRETAPAGSREAVDGMSNIEHWASVETQRELSDGSTVTPFVSAEQHNRAIEEINRRGDQLRGAVEALQEIVMASGPQCTVEGQIAAEALRKLGDVPPPVGEQ